MFYEDVKMKGGETVSGLAVAYGYSGSDWGKIWNDSKNLALTAARGKPERLQVGDTIAIPIPWSINSKTLNVEARGVGFEAKRSGGNGSRLSWTQTVYRHNQPIGPNPNPFCVDACTPDDNLPFYWTDAELTKDPTLRKTFIDHPSRNPPTAAAGTTRWRAVVSLAVITEKRVTIWDSLVWGFDMTSANVITKIGPRAATAQEVTGHLNLLRNGKGTGPVTFKAGGWSFRAAGR